MALVQLRAVTVVHAVDESGSLTTYYPGDWFRIGKQKAIELIESGQADLPVQAEAQKAIEQSLEGCGVLVRNGDIEDAKRVSGKHEFAAQECGDDLELLWDRTLIWDARYPLSSKQAALGFVRVQDAGRYDSWEMAAMLRSYDQLASGIGEPTDQQRTRETVGDLRLPVYEISAVWVRKTNATEAFIEAWNAQRSEGGSEEHAFLRALYTRRVLLCTLPAGWLRRLQ